MDCMLSEFLDAIGNYIIYIYITSKHCKVRVVVAIYIVLIEIHACVLYEAIYNQNVLFIHNPFTNNIVHASSQVMVLWLSSHLMLIW